MTKSIDCFIPYENRAQVQQTVDQLRSDPNVNDVHYLSEPPYSTHALQEIAGLARTRYILLYTKTWPLQLGYQALTRWVTIAEDSGAPLLYADHYTLLPDGSRTACPLIDYQLGSVRDDFAMGSLLLIRTEGLKAYVEQDVVHPYHYAGL